MNRQQFFQWMHNPYALNPESAKDLQELIREYPYFQTARILHLMNLKQQKDFRFEQELRRVAALSADRVRLREWLQLLEEMPVEESRNLKSELHEFSSVADPEKDIQLKNLEEQIKTSLKEIELKKSRLRELMEEKKAIAGDFDQTTEDLQDLPFRSLPRDPLLEEFLRQKEEQSPGRVSFYSPEESARKSIEDNGDFISDTLARLVAAQGKKDKAIKIYLKLILKYPQKSSYFAAQIEKLRKES